MRVAWIVILLVAGCGQKKEAPASGSGSATPPPVAGSATGSAAAPPAPTPPTCNVAGDYRLRYRSNGSDGWWLRLKLTADRAELVIPDVMDVLSAPLALKTDGCKVVITSKNDHSGDAKLEMFLDEKTNIVTGELSRTKNGEKTPADKVVITGRRDVGPIPYPACIKPGVYELSIGPTKWKLSEGTPRFGNCRTMTSQAQAKVRIEMLGDLLFADEVTGEDMAQSFARATLTRKSDCEYDMALEVTDWSFSGTVKFDGEKLTGLATKSRYQFFEDGEAGENLWACETKDAPFVGKRIAD